MTDDNFVMACQFLCSIRQIKLFSSLVHLHTMGLRIVFVNPGHGFPNFSPNLKNLFIKKYATVSYVLNVIENISTANSDTF